MYIIRIFAWDWYFKDKTDKEYTCTRLRKEAKKFNSEHEATMFVCNNLSPYIPIDGVVEKL